MGDRALPVFFSGQTNCGLSWGREGRDEGTFLKKVPSNSLKKLPKTRFCIAIMAIQ
jgi:hypothetical protein